MSSNNTAAATELWVKESLKNENLSNLKVSITGNSEKGDGYLGDIVFVTAEGTTENGDFKEFQLVLKCGKQDEQSRKTSPVKLAFEKEMYIYKEVMPAFAQLQTQKLGKQLFKSFPKCYKTFLNEDIEVIVLENLKSKGFNLHNRMQPMNLNHIKLVLMEYGKLHALSFALRDQQPETFKRLSSHTTDVMKEFITPEFLKTFDDVFGKALALLEKQKNFDALKKCKTLLENVSYYFEDIADKDDPQSIITHGDCWNNNFMFQYEGEDLTKPVDISILDWQISRLGSPVLDLSYFLYSCGSKNVFDNFDDLLKEYYKSFSTFLKQLGSDPEKLFSFESLKQHWKKYSTFGLAMMPIILHFALRSKDDVPDVYDLTDLKTVLPSMENLNEDMYNERAIAVMEHFAAYH